MQHFLELAFSFPTAIFSTAMMVFVGYWLLVIVGAVGFDFGVDGALEAKTGAVDGALEAKAGAIEALNAKSGLLSLLGFGTVPASVVLTVLTFCAWTASMVGASLFGPGLAGAIGTVGASVAVTLLALLSAALVGSVAVKPLRPLFHIRLAPTRQQLMGKVATVVSTQVDHTGRMGQADLADGEAGLLLSIFCGKENTLKKGDRVLILAYDEAKDSYEVEPVDWLLPEELNKLENPLAAEAIARAHLKQRLES